MKNKHFERLREAAKRYKKTAKNDSRWNKKLGIKVYHVYYPEGDENYREKSYWDDVAFIKGSQQVTVFWTHPRYMYEEELDQIAYQEANEKFPDSSDTNWFDKMTPIYKYLGKNKKRKRVKLWQMGQSPSREEFYTYWRDRKTELNKTSDYVQKCSFKVQQYSYCRGVSITCPMECRSEEELAALVKFVNACLDDPTLFNKTYGDYKYTKEDWLNENAKGESNTFIDHGVNL